MRFSNLHQHSLFSDGRDTPEEIVLTAIEKNFSSIGFSDHSFTEIDQSYCMKLEKYADYRAEITRLKDKYADKIDVFLGIELDGFSDIGNRSDFDYVIGSVHYLVANGVCYPIDLSPDIQLRYVEKECSGSVIRLACDYYEAVIASVERNRPDIVGHFDLITKFSLIDNNDPGYRKIAIEALDRILDTSAIIEVNTGAMARGLKDAPYPAPFLLEHILARGGDVILSADSHRKETMDFYFPESLEMLRQIGFTHIMELTESGFVRKKI